MHRSYSSVAIDIHGVPALAAAQRRILKCNRTLGWCRQSATRLSSVKTCVNLLFCGCHREPLTSHCAKLSSFALVLLRTPSCVKLFVPSLRGKRREMDSQAINVHQPWNQPRINAITVLTVWFVPVTKLPELHRDAPGP